MEESNSVKRERAKKRVKQLKGFFTHLMVYLFVNIMISTVIVVSLMYNGENFWNAFWNWGSLSTWFFWGIGVVFHGIKVFSYNPFFNKDWEERQIQKYLEEEQKEAEKYK